MNKYNKLSIQLEYSKCTRCYNMYDGIVSRFRFNCFACRDTGLLVSGDLIIKRLLRILKQHE